MARACYEVTHINTCPRISLSHTHTHTSSAVQAMRLSRVREAPITDAHTTTMQLGYGLAQPSCTARAQRAIRPLSIEQALGAGAYRARFVAEKELRRKDLNH